MGVWKDFEDWRDSLYCGGERPREWIEAELGARYEMYDCVYDKVVKVITCTEKNKAKIEESLNDTENDLWYYRKEKRNGN